MTKPIQAKSTGYNVLKYFLEKTFPLFFRNIEIRGAEKLPFNEPVIFAANHQNGLMDPLAVILFQKAPVVYMARADIFQNPLNRIFLRYIKIAPIYRIRDGFETLARNEQQMNLAVSVLTGKCQLGLMPEGNHGENHKLRPFVKGLFRIAFQAEEKLAGSAHVKIVPVGIDYSFYQHAGADLVVSYGHPIEVSGYMKAYTDSPALAMQQIRSDLSSAISSLMLDVRSEKYDKIYWLACLGMPAWLESAGISLKKAKAGERLDARKSMAALLEKLEHADPDKLQNLSILTERVRLLPAFPNLLAEWMETPFSATSVFSLLGGALCIPLLLLNHPSWLMNRLIVSKVEDKQMHSTFVFTLGMVFNVLTCLLVAVLLSGLFQWSAGVGLLSFIGAGIACIAGEKIRQHLRLPWKQFLYVMGSRKKLVETCRADYLLLKREMKALIG